MTSPGVRVCSQCAHMNPPNSRFCNQCGKSIVGGPEPVHYTPRHLSEKILSSRSAMEGEHKPVTVLFVDIKGSVALSQQANPERWHQIMDRFFSLLTESVHDYEGTINQYTGDGIMALFGAPIAHEDHAVRACRAALAIRERLRILAVDLKQSDGIEFAARQGMNSGEVVVGRIGDDLRMDYTAQGQSVGLAARMEQRAPANGILLSRFTRDLVAGKFELKERSALSVKGFDERVRSYELRQAISSQSEDAAQTYPLLGRSRELTLLEGWRQQTQASACGMMVTIQAGTGLGKSRLCQAFTQQCHEAGIRTYSLRMQSHHRVEPDAPLRVLFSQLLDLPPTSAQDFAGKLAQALEPYQPLPQPQVDNLLVLFGQADEADSVAAAPRRLELALQLALRLLHEGVLRQHAVFVIENIHWLNDPRVEPFLDAAFDGIPHMPVLFVVTARQDHQLRWNQQSELRHLHLAPLDEQDSRALLDHMLGDEATLDGLKQEIVQHAGGNPMFIDELVRQLFDSGALSRDGRGVKLKKAPDSIQLPPSVQAVVAARIDSLPQASKHLLRIAAVIGRQVPRELLQQAYGQSGFDAALARLQEQGFLHSEKDQTAVLLFTQPLFRSVAYSALLGEQRAEMHRLVADILQQQDRPSQALSLARHLAASGQVTAAAERYLQAAARLARQDIPEACQSLLNGLQVLAQLPDSQEQRSARLQLLARQLQIGIRDPESLPDLQAWREQGEALVEQGVDDWAQGLFMLGSGSYHLAHGQHDSAQECYQQALDWAGDSPALKLAATVPVCFSSLFQGHLEQAVQQTDAALQQLFQAGRDSRQVQRADAWLNGSCEVALQLVQAWALLWLGRVETARQHITVLQDTAQRQGYGEQSVAALSASAWLAALCGDAQRAVDEANAAMQQAQKMQNMTAEMFSLMAMGRALLRQQDWMQAISVLEDGLARLQGRGFGLGELVRMQLDLALANLGAGDTRRARQLAQQAVDQAQDLGNPILLAEARLAQVRAGLMSARPLGFLKRYRSHLDEVESCLDVTGAELLRPELLLLRTRWLELREDSSQTELLREQAHALLTKIGIALPPLGH